MAFGDGTFSMGRYFPQGSFKMSMWDLVAVLEQKVVDQMDTSLSLCILSCTFYLCRLLPCDRKENASLNSGLEGTTAFNFQTCELNKPLLVAALVVVVELNC